MSAAGKKAVAAAARRKVHTAVKDATVADFDAAAAGDQGAKNRVAVAAAMNEVHPALRGVEAAPGSHYRILKPKDGTVIDDAARCAMAQRVLELGASSGGYVPQGARAKAQQEHDRAEAGASRDAARSNPITPGRETTQGDVMSKNKGFLAGTTKEIEKAHAANVKEQAAIDKKKKVEADAKAKADEAARKRAKVSKAAKKGAVPSQLAAGAKAAAAASKKTKGNDGAKFAGYPLNAQVKVLSKESDFADGSIRDQVFKKLLKATTVGEAQKASPDPWHLKTAVKAKKLKVG